MPEFNIDPDFSVYQLVKRSMQDVSVLSHRRTMSIISNEIENATLMDNAHGTIFSSFQRMSRFLPQIKRYRELAQQSAHVYVFGVMDTTDLPQIDNLTYVPLKPNDQLAKEWFLVSYGEKYFSALATEELSDIDDPDPERVFKGVWTFDVFVVGILYEWLCRIVGQRVDMVAETRHDYLNQAQLLTNTIGRMSVRVMDHKGSHQETYSELEKIMQKTLHPTLNHMQQR